VVLSWRSPPNGCPLGALLPNEQFPPPLIGCVLLSWRPLSSEKLPPPLIGCVLLG
jgi:hypothetical protein